MIVFDDRFGDFSSERLNFSVVNDSDAAELQAITNDRAIIDAISFLNSPFTLDDCRSLIKRFTTSTDRVFVGRTKKDVKMVSLIGAHLAEGQRVEIGYWIASAHQGQGYGFEAGTAMIGQVKSVLPAFVLFAECAPENTASSQLLEKLGFEATGKQGARPGRKLFRYRK